MNIGKKTQVPQHSVYNLDIMHIDQGIFSKEFSARVPDLDKQVTRLKAERESLNMVHTELLKTKHSSDSNRAGSSVDTIMKVIPCT